MHKISPFILGLLIFAGFLVPAVSSAATIPPSLGINLAQVAYFSSEQPFLNIFKTEGSWAGGVTTGTRYGEEQGVFQLDANEYPTSMQGIGPAAGQTFTEIDTLFERNTCAGSVCYPAGNYVFLYDGTGTFNFDYDCINSNIVSSVPGRIVIKIPTPGQDGCRIDLTSTGANGTYAKNFRFVYSPDSTGAVVGTREALLNSGEIFNPDFIARIKPFKTLRFMDWMATIGTTVGSSWATRTMPSSAFWGAPNVGSRSVPVEVMTALCNEVQADCWFNMPAPATDAYITQFATLVHAQLHAPLKVYIEFSNEIWNYGGDQAPLIAAGHANFPACVGNDFCAAFDQGILRAIQSGNIWKSVWGADSARVVRLMAGQAGYVDRNRYMMDFTAIQDGGSPTLFSGPASANVDAFAIAPYFGDDVASNIMNAAIQAVVGNLNLQYYQLSATQTSAVDAYIASHFTVTQVLAQASADVTSETASWTQQDNALASARGLPLIGYEGGQTLVGGGGLENSQPLTTLLTSANDDPRMGPITTAFVNAWYQNGGTLMNYYSDVGVNSKWGSWGALENVLQTTSPKYGALVASISGTPVPTPAPTPTPAPAPAPTATLSASPTSITAGGSTSLSWSSTNATSCSGTGFSASGTTGSVSATPTVSTTYDITCTGAGGSATGSATVAVSAPIPTPVPTPVPAPTPTPVPVPTPTPTPTPVPTTGSFSIGTRVKTTAKLNVRKQAAASGKPVGQQKTGALGTVTGGPIVNGGYNWYTVNFDSGADGWVAGAYLTASLSINDLQTQIADISAQIDSLHAQIQALTSGQTAAVGAASGASAAPTCTLTADQTLVQPGEQVTLTWASTNATSASSPSGNHAPNGSVMVTPTVTTTYQKTVLGPGGTATCKITVTVTQPVDLNINAASAAVAVAQWPFSTVVNSLTDIFVELGIGQ